MYFTNEVLEQDEGQLCQPGLPGLCNGKRTICYEPLPGEYPAKSQFYWIERYLNTPYPRVFAYFWEGDPLLFDPDQAEICLVQTLSLQAEMLDIDKKEWAQMILLYTIQTVVENITLGELERETLVWAIQCLGQITSPALSEEPYQNEDDPFTAFLDTLSFE